MPEHFEVGDIVRAINPPTTKLRFGWDSLLHLNKLAYVTNVDWSLEHLTVSFLTDDVSLITAKFKDFYIIQKNTPLSNKLIKLVTK